MMNNFIFEYYQKIKDGTIIAGEFIRLFYCSVIKGLECGEFIYDSKKAGRAIRYIEHYCRHHEGPLAPGLIKLELWEKALVSVIFGIVDPAGRRWFREIFLVIGRKNGKTLLAAAIASYMIFAEGEYGARIYFTAPKLDQANLCYDAFTQMVEKEPELDERAKKRKTDIYIAETNSSARAIAFSAKKSDGFNAYLCVCDEIASWAGDAGKKFYEVMKSSQGARSAGLMLAISSAGYANDGAYDELFTRATAVLKGTAKEKRLAPIIYQIEDPEKWNDINELQKSMPNLGVSVSVDYMLDEIAVAENSLSKKAEFLTKYCNVKQSSSAAWFDYSEIAACFGDPLELEDFRDCYAVVGIDLSQTTDLTACVVLIEKNGKIYGFARFFMPANKLEERTAEDHVPYEAYVQRGFLKLSGENYVDYQDCYDYVIGLLNEYGILPLKVGYDRYSAQYLIKDLKAAGCQCDDVYQGENLTPVIVELEGLVKDGKFNFGDNDLLKIHLLNAALKINNETNRKRLVKISAYDRIDGMAALLDAICVRQKFYEEIGEMLKNEE